MCIGIIRNNSLVGGHARAEVRTPDTECVTLYRTILCYITVVSNSL